MKGKIILLLSLLFMCVSTYGYAGDCYYNPDGSMSIADFLAGKCPEQTQVVAAHKLANDPSRYYPDNLYGKDKITPKAYDNGRYRPRGLTKQSFTNKGYGMKIIKYRGTSGHMVYGYKISLPCFYTAPGNEPCSRGRMSK